MLKTSGLKRSGDNRRLPKIPDESNEDMESAITSDANANSENPEFAQGDIPETSMDIEIDNWGEFCDWGRGWRIGDFAFTGCGVSETSTCNEMYDLTVNKARRNVGNEEAFRFLQFLPLLEMVVMGNAKSSVLANGNVLSVQGYAISQIEGTNDMGDFIALLRGTGQNRKRRQVIDRNEFPEWRNTSLGERNMNEEHNLEHPVGDYASEPNREIDG